MKTQAQRNLILDAAFDKFRRLGIRRVTLDEIAHELRISKKTLYVHFASKEELVRACTAQLRERVFPAVNAAIHGHGSAAESLLAVWQALGEIPRTVTREMFGDLKAEYPHLWTEIQTQRRAVVASMESLFRRGRTNGDLWPEIHPRVLVRVMLAVVDHVLVPDVILQGEFTLAEAFATVVTLMVRGTLTHPPPRAPATVPKPRRRAARPGRGATRRLPKRRP